MQRVCVSTMYLGKKEKKEKFPSETVTLSNACRKAMPNANSYVPVV